MNPITASALECSNMVPAELSVLIWAPLLTLCAALIGWLWVLIAFQKIDRQVDPSRRASASQFEATNTIQNAAMPEGIA